MDLYNNICIYEIGNTAHSIEIVEFAPSIFKDIRKKCGVSDDLLF